jgi:hypothetical protein
MEQNANNRFSLAPQGGERGRARGFEFNKISATSPRPSPPFHGGEGETFAAFLEYCVTGLAGGLSPKWRAERGGGEGTAQHHGRGARGGKDGQLFLATKTDDHYSVLGNRIIKQFGVIFERLNCVFLLKIFRHSEKHAAPKGTETKKCKITVTEVGKIVSPPRKPKTDCSAHKA